MLDRIALSLTMPLLLGAGLPEGWESSESKAGRFTVAFPAKPKEITQSVATATSKLQVTLLVAEGRNDSSFVVSFLDYPEKDLKTGTIDKRLDLARDGAVSSTGGKLKSETPIELAGHKGRELVIDKDGETIARMRIYFVERRLYQVMVLGSAPTKDVTVFLESFRLNK